MMNLHLLHRIMIYAAVRGAAYGCNKEAHTCPPIPGCTGMIDKIDSYRITAWEVTLDGNPLEISDGRITVRDDSNGMMNAVTLLCEAVRNGRKYVFDTGSPAFDCDITAQCTIDGRELYLRITGIAP